MTIEITRILKFRIIKSNSYDYQIPNGFQCADHGFIGNFSLLFPREILDDVPLTSGGIATLLVQVLGSLYIGFAVINWMLRSSPIGGIYSCPLAMANFTHFNIGFLSLVKAVISDAELMALWIPCFVYLIFASLFGSVLFKRPARK